MLRRLREKSSAARILQSDASQLPFPADRFDVVMTVHVLHLIPAWRESLREFRRVLVPQGVYLNVRTWASAGVSIREQIRLHWQEWLEAHGVHAGNPGLQGSEELQQELQSLGAQVTEREVVRYPFVFPLREQLERFASRVFSDAWDVPDAIFDASIEELRTWVAQEYGDLDRLREDPLRFVIEVARFDR
jgi:SAM-dependent methyltransferase